jgi:diguanylate cyclase (GGDEF)-like protein
MKKATVGGSSMSLAKQIWLAIALIMTVAFSTSLLINVYSARHYLEQQLQVKNLDNATSLALSLSQIEKDPIMVELMVAAQFDIGHYRFIRITSPNGETLVDKTYGASLEGAPPWFVRLFPIHTTPGQAQIQDGWRQYGTLTLASHDQYAYKSLWEGTLELLRWFLLGMVIAGTIGSMLVRWLTRPLRDVVEQAHALAERRFQTVAEPLTPELRAVTRAMNDMVGRLKAMFTEEAQRLEALRYRVNHDAVTGLANREHFLSQLRELLTGEQDGAGGSLIMIRLCDLNQLNEKLGHKGADQLLKSLGDLLQQSQPICAGRLKGGEFALAFSAHDSTAEVAQTLHGRLMSDWLPQWQAKCPELFHLAAVQYEQQQGLSELLSRADEALAQAQAKGPNNWHAAEISQARVAIPAERWRALLNEALGRDDRLSLAFFPVLSCPTGRLLHREPGLRLLTEGSAQPLPDGHFRPIAATLHLSAPLDLFAVRLALRALGKTAGDIALNLSAESLSDFGFHHQLEAMLKQQPALCQRLLFEVTEYGVSRQREAFSELALHLVSGGCGDDGGGQRHAHEKRAAQGAAPPGGPGPGRPCARLRRSGWAARQAVVITGHGADQVEAALAPWAQHALPLRFVRQEPQLGTGHAVQQAVPVLADDGVTLVLSGDVPLTRPDTLQALLRPAPASTWPC